VGYVSFSLDVFRFVPSDVGDEIGPALTYLA